ncbi:CHAT domain-containing protein [Streptomyces sp. NPDC051636]|uniref:CHAT domain-containing tetratricopeptide repeat protein n=1 Tax=Streptomyces sp. NPDC051636 TaxID=3365663 RepID=UPI0037A08E18
MTTHTADAHRPPEEHRQAERERLLEAVRQRLDRAGGPQGNARLHTEEARGETDRLLWHLVGPAPDGGFGLDPEVAYVLGVTCLLRADDRPEAPTAEADGRYGLLLLAPFYCHLPGQPDALPPPLRAGLDHMLGPGGGRPEDPDEIVREHAASLVNVAILLLETGIALPYPEALEVAARLSREAMPYLSPEGPDRALAGCNLGYALLVSAHSGQAPPERITEAVEVLRTAFAATPESHPNHARCANGLGLALVASAAQAEDRTRLPEAIAMLRTATRTATGADANVAQMHSDLGHALTAYALSADEGEEVGPEVREEAVAALRRALELTPAEEQAALRDRLDRLAAAALIGLPEGDRPRAAAQAEEAVEALRLLLHLTSDDHPERGDVLLRLAHSLVVARQPQEALGLLAEAEPLFAGDTERQEQAQALLFEAAMVQAELSSRDDLTTEQLADEQAIDDLMRSLLSGEASDHPLGAVLKLLGLGGTAGGGSGSQSRGQELMEFGELVLGYPDQVSLSDIFAKVVERQARHIAQLPEEERDQALAEFLEGGEAPDGLPGLFEGPVDTSELDELLEIHERVLPRLPADDRMRPLLSTTQKHLRLVKLMHEAANAPDGTEERLRSMRATLPLMRELLTSLPAQLEEMGIKPELFGGHTALAFAEESPFDQLEAMQEGVRAARRRLADLAPDAPERADALASLAICLFVRHTRWAEESDYEEARAIARELTAGPEPDPRSAGLLTYWTSAAESRLQSARLVGSQPPQAGQSPNPTTRLASDGAAQALDRRDPVEALETLEDGRAHLLSQALNARREMEVLHGADADLHARLRAALERQRALYRAMEPGHRPTTEEEATLRAAVEDAARLVAELQRRPGFQRFLTPLPLGLDDLRPAAEEGPVVSINVNPRRCDALALCSDGLRTVPLPRLCASDLVAQAESFRLAVEVLAAGPRDPLFEDARDVFTGTLAWLWDVLAEPVLDALGHTRPPLPGAPWPRLWWSPSGVLNSFPLHAAGHHEPDAPQGAAVLDRVASSYTPTLRALLHSRARRRAAPGRRRVLAVAMPETAGQAPLGRTVTEATAAASAGGGVPLVGPDATREAVRTAVLDAAVVHFACHADSDPEDPATGRLLLSDGDLLIRDIAELRLETAELAYLSACGTARGSAAPALVDEVIHLASAFQLAGYAQSVATLWEVGDAFAATAAADFHRALAPALSDPGPLPAALTLHHTVRALRTADPDRPWTWAALVHAGA